jgi:hypothetical protein
MGGGIFNGNAQADTAQKKFGNASLKLDGTGDYVTFPNDPRWQVGNGDFCVECWVRPNATKLQAIVCKRPGAGLTSEWVAYIDATGKLIFQGYATTGNVLNISGTSALSVGTWYHVAFSRSGTIWRIFLNGSLEASGTQSGTPSSNTELLYIGRDQSNTARDFSGWIDEVRVTSGVARYTAAFTAPSAAFPRR